MNKFNGSDMTSYNLDSSFELTSHKGDIKTAGDFKGYVVALFFGFTHCPDVCPTTMAILNETYSKLKDAEKDNLQIVLLTLDPERDSVEKLADYVPYFNQDFIGVTGNKHLISSSSSWGNAKISKTFINKPACSFC